MSTRSTSNKKNAEIIGVFSKAIYLECDRKVLVIHDSSWGYVPFGIAEDNIEEFIRNGDFEVGKSIEVTLPQRKKAATVSKLTLSRKRIEETEKIISESGSKDGIIGYYNSLPRVKTAVDSLFSALTEGKDATLYAIKLIGLGRGLTPSGDDFLAGMFYLFGMANADFSRLATSVKENISRTSKISGAYLCAVLENEHFTIYEHSSLALLGNDSVRAHTDFVLPLGASSGTDTLCGALFAAKVLERLNKNRLLG